MSEHITDLVEKLGLKFEAELVEDNPKIFDTAHGSRHWLCRIELPGHAEAYETHFSKGPTLVDPPDIEEVLGCVAADIKDVRYISSFEEWLEEYGFKDLDSDVMQKLHKCYEAIQADDEKLTALLGDQMDYLLWGEEPSPAAPTA